MSLRKAVIAACLALSFPGNAPVRAQIADIAILNANVYTLQAENPRARALAIAGGRIIGVYTDAVPDKLFGLSTRRIDAGGRTIIPGLINSHIHAIRAGLTFSNEVTFDGARSIDEAMKRLGAAAARSAEDEWIIVAGGWTPQQFAESRRPTREEVENAAPGRRVYVQLFYRAAFMSDAGRDALGLDLDNPPPNLSYERDEHGGANGWMTGGVDAITALWERLPKPTVDAAKAGTRAFFQHSTPMA